MSTKKGNGIPASRQKNCNACVQAKRRCDRRVPVCSRCISKQVACTYGQTERAISGSSPKDGFEAAPFTEGLQVGSSSYPAFSPEPSLGVDYLGTMPMDSQLENPTLGSLPLPALDADSNDDIPMDPFFNMLDTASTSNKDQWLIPTQQGYVGERPNTPADEGTELAYQKMACFCDDVQPWQLYDTKTQMFYLVNRVKGFTSDAAARNATPFMHKYLYKSHTPPCILDCFSTNVIYSNRTPENMAMVMRAVQRSVTELIQNETGRTVVTPIEKLARTQTLFLLQIIRLLDGDVILRAQGENDIPLLKIWLGELCRVRENLGTPADAGDNAIGDQPPHDWEIWIFAESIRRTIVMAYSILTLYEMMKNSESADNYDPWAYIHRWTLSRHLWEADSSFAFYRAWKDKPHYIIKNYSFEEFLKFGRGEDVDEFAEILLAVYMGVDETKEFVSARQHQQIT